MYSIYGIRNITIVKKDTFINFVISRIKFVLVVEKYPHLIMVIYFMKRNSK